MSISSGYPRDYVFSAARTYADLNSELDVVVLTVL
tara:strand:- start:4996 stop:5100 length:105 start_codon:yes stop_codon:yes gene_type:complete